jgi:hypothetical protein
MKRLPPRFEEVCVRNNLLRGSGRRSVEVAPTSIPNHGTAGAVPANRAVDEAADTGDGRCVSILCGLHRRRM